MPVRGNPFVFNRNTKPMDELKEKTADLVDHVEDLANTYYKLGIVTVIQKGANLSAALMMVLLICVVTVFVFLFSGIALALWMSTLVDSYIGGFLITAGLFIIFLLIVVLLRKHTILPLIRNLIVRKFYDKD